MAKANNKVTRIEFLEELNKIGLSPTVDGNQADTITRAEAAVILADALPPLNTGIAGGRPAPYHDLNTLNPVQQAAVSTLYSLGIMVGDDQQLFHGEQKLTHEELDLIVERTRARLQSAPSFPSGPISKPTPAPSYEVSTDLSALPPDVQDRAIAVQGTSGAITTDSGDSTYLILSAGERYTGGYVITVENVTETDSRIEVTVGLQTPAPGGFALQAITYPQTVLRFPQTVKPIVVLNTEALTS
ncbi:protease complex subunit PrcB family protein [Tumebacillus permanentifrigoris]|uniref:S-layer family protein n=1 Tax=Tumebacillus permanentifrigoris TaxID=378543 RepID=A0A316D4A9_9BACL|nr:protease complex subunit PrcB family protein [Tumebacillus permanentifrigoris]PWK05045.1 S-layer family protein [Tumebacillus permanentifrigoris]